MARPAARNGSLIVPTRSWLVAMMTLHICLPFTAFSSIMQRVGYGWGSCQARHHTGIEATMQVQVKLFSRFREHLPPDTRGEATISLPDGATIDDLIDHLGIVRRVKLVTINGERQADYARLLRDDDRVRIFPVVVGG
jgi:molybdopterin converting factor small subunit